MTPALRVPAKAPFAYANLVFFGLLILLCYAPAVTSLANDWRNDPNMGHGFFVPAVVGYMLWQEKDELKKIQPRTSWWGLLVVLLGAAQSIVGTLGVELFLSRSALIVTLTGAVWFLGGTALLKRLAFPLFLLCFMVPLPTLVYNSLTFPLQMLASRLAGEALMILGIPVLREGSVLKLPNMDLNVVEACSGIRSLLSLTFLSLVYGYFFEKKTWIRWALFVATVPIAILANGGRVATTGILSQINPEWAEGFFHESTGFVIFMLALGFLLLLHRGLRWVNLLVKERT